MIPLFDSDSSSRSHEPLEEGALLLRGFATSEAPALVGEVARIAQGAPFRHLLTPGGHTMSVAMTNCGRLGWVSDRTGYRYGGSRMLRLTDAECDFSSKWIVLLKKVYFRMRDNPGPERYFFSPACQLSTTLIA